MLRDSEILIFFTCFINCHWMVLNSADPSLLFDAENFFFSESGSFRYQLPSLVGIDVVKSKFGLPAEAGRE